MIQLKSLKKKHPCLCVNNDPIRHCEESDDEAILIVMYYVYIMTNPGHTVLYTGVTNDLMRRVYEHRQGKADSFTSKYHVTKLVWYQESESVLSAIAEEKRIKGGSRKAKIAMIEMFNPDWSELMPI